MSARIPSIGTLTDRVRIERRMSEAEPEGGHAALFVPSGTVWARVRMLSARMAAAGEGPAAEISHSVVIRFRPDVGPGDRIVYRGRRLDVISAADMNGRRAYLSCACTERGFVR